MAELSDLNWRFTKEANPDFSRKREHVKQALVQVENIKIELEGVQVRILSFFSKHADSCGGQNISQVKIRTLRSDAFNLWS
jgi:hypothetical protein